MNDIEIRRSILQYAYNHRHDYPQRFVSTNDMPFLKGLKSSISLQNIDVLKGMGLIKVFDSAWQLISLTTSGILLVENRKEFNTRFAVRKEMPEQTSRLIDTVQLLIGPQYPAVMRQFQKAKDFLYHSDEPDYLNSVKEAVGAVEGLAKAICDRPKDTLPDLLPELKRRHLAHAAMGKIIEAIYAVRSDEPGIAHGAYTSSGFEYADAEFILDISSCVLIYLARKEPRVDRRDSK